jgi:hypothetical protein
VKRKSLDTLKLQWLRITQVAHCVAGLKTLGGAANALAEFFESPCK